MIIWSYTAVGSMKFSITARVLHWLSSFVILWATISGLLLACIDFGLGSELKNQILNFNVSLTFVFIPLFLWRTVHRLNSDPIAYPSHFTEKEIQLASGLHRLLYLVIWVVLLTGVLMMEKDFSIFNVAYFPHLLSDKNSIELFTALHHYATYILTAAIIVHILAVVKHEYTGVRILKRML